MNIYYQEKAFFSRIISVLDTFEAMTGDRSFKTHSTLEEVINILNYEKGKQYCEYDCKTCSEVCPSGAIKRITLDEKQNTKIAMAMINEKCTNCEHCISFCPKQAIISENGIVRVDGSKCIGCGKCKTFCHNNAIEIFGIKNQTVI